MFTTEPLYFPTNTLTRLPSGLFTKPADTGINFHSQFKNQKVIVTGASGAIGHSICKLLLEAGAYVAMIARNRTELNPLMKIYPEKAFVFTMDLTDPEEINACFRNMMKALKGDLDVLIHAAGSYQNVTFENLTLKEWDASMNINCRSVVHLTSLAVPFLETSKGNKSIVCLTYESSGKPVPGELAFSVSKAMTNMFIECMALELAMSKIRINGVAIAAANTDFRVSKENGLTTAENKDFLESYSQIKPLLTNEDVPSASNIADVALWLASNEALFITGEIVNVDDGMGLTSRIPKVKSIFK